LKTFQMLSLIVLAAGAGSRFGGPKQLEPLGPHGERLFEYALFDAARAGFRRVVFVVRDELERDFHELGDRWRGRLRLDTRVAVQRLGDLPDGRRPGARTKPWGTGHAVLAARGAIDGPFAVINADDFYGPEAYRLAAAASAHAMADGTTTVVAMRLADTLSAHGPVTRAVCALDGARVAALDEVHDITREGAALAGRDANGRRVLTGEELVSMNFWVCPPAMVVDLRSGFEAFLNDRGEDGSEEFRLPEAISALAARGAARVAAVHAPGPWFGLTHAADRETVAGGLRRLADLGWYPTPLWSK
jgi:UTP-glucose-1-phosphate uridylyltransferase